MSATFRIRHAEPADAAGLHMLFSEVSAYAGTLQLPYPSLSAWTRRLTDMPGHVVQLVADERGALVGAAGFDVIQHPRRRHVANLGMAVSHDRRGEGIGTALLLAAVETAERWHGVRRIELEVYVDNAAAIALYARHGFVKEGLARAYALRDGAYVDVMLMARLATDV